MIWKEMMDMIGFWNNEFIEWYFVQPIYGQILALVGIIAIIALTITLIYYVFKGIYYLLKGIGLGIFKLCEGFYNLVSGKYKSDVKSQNKSSQIETSNSEFMNTGSYCTECGRKFFDKMLSQLYTNGIIFCANCGKEFKNEIRNSPILTH